MESLTSPRTMLPPRSVERLGRTVVDRLRERRYRRLVKSTPRRRISDLAGVARATVVGRVVTVAGGGPAVEAWQSGASEGRKSGRRRLRGRGRKRGKRGRRRWRGQRRPRGRERSVSGRTTRPFLLDDGSGQISVRIPPGGGILFDDSNERSGETDTVECGDRVTVTGRVVRDTDDTLFGSVLSDGVLPGDVLTNETVGRCGRRTLTGPTFVLVASP
ncbi:hypothetical protein [Haloferax sp. DFSO52]|uniref:hypothetical protein n=1 Tax=Haloferax sp. DFSO52 TaxID=3388505 RepID=UPI003A88C61B